MAPAASGSRSTRSWSRVARQNARDAGVSDRVTFIEGDLFTADHLAATVVTLYLSTSMLRQLEPKLKSELRPGTRIVSHQFWFQGWPPDRTTRVESSELFLWRIPLPDLLDLPVSTRNSVKEHAYTASATFRTAPTSVMRVYFERARLRIRRGDA